MTEAAKDRLAVLGYDPAFGARPLKRVLQREILEPLSEEIIKGVLVDGCGMRVDYEEGAFVFSKEEPWDTAH